MPVTDGLVDRLWKEASTTIKREFGLPTSTSAPTDLKLIENGPLITLQGSSYTNGTLTLSNLILDRPELLRGLIYRECLRKTLSEYQICEEAKDDLSNEFARQHLSGQDQEDWVREWSSQVPRRRVSTVTIYDPSRAFPLLYEITGPNALHQILSAVLLEAKYGLVMDLESYLAYFQTCAQRFVASLTPADVKIIEYVINHPDCQQKEISDAVQLTSQWVSQRLRHLKRLSVLREFNHVPFSRIGIRMFNVLLCDPTMSLTSSFFQDCPFLYAYRPAFTGPWNIYATLAVPDCIDNIRAVGRFEELLQHRRVSNYITEVVFSGSKLSLQHFDPINQSWNIPWEQIQLEADADTQSSSYLELIVRPSRRTQMCLEATEIQILDMMRRGVNSIDKIRDVLRIGQNRVVDCIAALRRNGLLERRWEVHNIGLCESAYIIVVDRHIGEMVARWLFEHVPRVHISFNVNKEMFAIVELPCGGVCRLIEALQPAAPRVIIGMIDKSVYGGWGFPTRLWDVKRQRWCAEAHAIKAWLENLQQSELVLG